MKAISAAARRMAEALWWVMVCGVPYKYWGGDPAQDGCETTIQIGALQVDPTTGEVLEIE